MAQTSVQHAVVERTVAAVRERSADEVARILRAARAVLVRKGYDGLRVDDVLAEAGLSTRAFYRHFRGKAEVFLALFDDEMTRSAERLAGVVEQADGPEAQVGAWVEAVLALAYEPKLARRARLFAGEQGTLAHQFPDEVERCVRLQLAPLVAAIAAGAADGTFPAAEPEADARAIHHLCAGLLADQLEGTARRTAHEAVALAIGFALQALRADGRERRP